MIEPETFADYLRIIARRHQTNLSHREWEFILDAAALIDDFVAVGRGVIEDLDLAAAQLSYDALMAVIEKAEGSKGA